MKHSNHKALFPVKYSCQFSFPQELIVEELCIIACQI